MSLFDYLKNIFIILIFLQLAPTLFNSIKKQYADLIYPRTKVALINIKGILSNSDHYNKYIKKYFEDSEVKAILLKVDCPGSTAGTSQAIFNEIKMLKKTYPKKPIITLVENICASGGYYIACATDHIIAPPSAIIGSIGSAFQNMFQLKEFIQQFKIKYKSLSAGKYKNTTDPFVDMTAEQEKLLQDMLNDSYCQFAIDVSIERKLSTNNKNDWAEGKIFTGNQALKLGLIDSIGSAFTAIAIIREKALIEEDQKIRWVIPPVKSGLAEWFGKGQEEESESMFTRIAEKIFTFFERKYFTKKVV